jgi:hypothetical protein
MSILSAIIEIFKNNNDWMDYSEIYSKLNPELFGPNKNSEQGKKNMVSKESRWKS